MQKGPIIEAPLGTYRWSYEMSLFKNPNIL